MMKPEMWVAIYAAVVSTSALLLNFRGWFESRVRLRLSVLPDAVLIGGSRDTERNLLALTVVNRGGELTTLENMVILKFDHIWKRWRVRPAASYIIPNPQAGGTGTLPFELDSKRKWIGIARRRSDLDVNIDDGKHYVGVYATHRDKPYLVRIPVPKTKLPEGIKKL